MKIINITTVPHPHPEAPEPPPEKPPPPVEPPLPEEPPLGRPPYHILRGNLPEELPLDERLLKPPKELPPLRPLPKDLPPLLLLPPKEPPPDLPPPPPLLPNVITSITVKIGWYMLWALICLTIISHKYHRNQYYNLIIPRIPGSLCAARSIIGPIVQPSTGGPHPRRKAKTLPNHGVSMVIADSGHISWQQ